MMRALLLALAVAMTIPFAAQAGTDISDACYKDCEAQTHSNPEYKACVARAADKADAALNKAYQSLLDAVRAAGKDMGQDPSTQITGLKDAQKQWIAYRDANCTFEDSLAFGGTAIGGNYSSCLCALSYERVNDFERMAKDVMGEP
jgi:uncharacterized protein YecT (DUF1311 family)